MMQALFVIVAAAVAFMVPQPVVERLCVLQRRFVPKNSRHPLIAVFCAALLSLLLSAGFAILLKLPVPHFADEFGYLLQADTFLHGRLKNPTHPVWQFFETFHVIQQPCYAAKYPPGQGAMLALGRLLGHPIIGVWLSTSFAAGAFCWMLLAWLPRGRGALLGAILFATNPMTLMWNWTYFGGSLAFGAGALFFGGIRRLLITPRILDACAASLGLAILANTRPYEGAALLLASSIALFVTEWRPRFRWACITKMAILPACILASALAFDFYYNWTITGNPMKMPYMVYSKQYDSAPLFLLQAPKPTPVYRHAPMRDLYLNVYLPLYESQRSLSGFVRAVLFEKLPQYFAAVWNGLAVFFLVLPFLWKRDRWLRYALAFFVVFAIATFGATYTLPYMTAPALPLFYMVLFRLMFRLGAWKFRGLPRGKAIILFQTALMIVVPVFTFGIYRWKHDRSITPVWDQERARLVQNLSRASDRHLLVVRYGSGHDPGHEWVYNDADIDASKVVFARSMGGQANARLLDYFKDRKIWLVQPDTMPLKLEPYLANP